MIGLKVWYMRDNHTFRLLPLDVENALAVMRAERDVGHTYGMLFCTPDGVLPGNVHARSAAEWAAFEAAARPWLETAVAGSETPNDRAHRRDGSAADGTSGAATS